MTGGRIAPAALVGLLVGSCIQDAGMQPRPDPKRKLKAEQRLESVELMKLVDRVEAGELPGGDAWLTWEPHFMRAPDGRTYVPFTLKVRDAPQAFASVGMYIRAVKVDGTDDGSRSRWSTGMAGANAGDIPVSVPERQFVRPGVPTPGENSAILAATERYLQRTPNTPAFEDLHFAALEATGPDGSRLIRRALALSAGKYDVYIAIRESTRAKGTAVPPKAAVFEQTLLVPDFSTGALQLSSVVLAARLSPLAERLSAPQQAEHPYALGAAEIVPAPDSRIERDGVLSLFFFVYDPTADAEGKPDVAVTYRFYEGILERFFIATQPQVFNRQSLERDFTLKASGNALAVDATVPMQKFQPGPYRLAIEVTDRLAGRSVTRDLRFTVVSDRGASGR